MCNHPQKYYSTGHGDFSEADAEISYLIKIIEKCGYLTLASCQDDDGDIYLVFSRDEFEELILYCFEKYDEDVIDFKNDEIDEIPYSLYNFLQHKCRRDFMFPDYHIFHDGEDLIYDEEKIVFHVTLRFPKELRDEFIELWEDIYSWKLDSNFNQEEYDNPINIIETM